MFDKHDRNTKHDVLSWIFSLNGKIHHCISSKLRPKLYSPQRSPFFEKNCRYSAVCTNFINSSDRATSGSSLQWRMYVLLCVKSFPSMIHVSRAAENVAFTWLASGAEILSRLFRRSSVCLPYANVWSLSTSLCLRYRTNSPPRRKVILYTHVFKAVFFS